MTNKRGRTVILLALDPYLISSGSVQAPQLGSPRVGRRGQGVGLAARGPGAGAGARRPRAGAGARRPRGGRGHRAVAHLVARERAAVRARRRRLPAH